MSRTLPIGNEGPRAVDFALGPIYLRRNPQVALCGASNTSSSGVRERPGYRIIFVPAFFKESRLYFGGKVGIVGISKDEKAGEALGN